VLASQSLTGGGARNYPGATPQGAAPVPDSVRARNDSLVRAIDEFVKGGGTLVAWNQGTASAIASLRLPVRNVLAGVARKDHFTGGSILRVQTDPAHPVMGGMPAEADVFVSNSPAFTTLPGFEGSVLAKYQTEGSPLRSGFLSGAQHIRGYAAAVDVKHGGGHVVLLAFQPQWRGQPTGTFRVVFNALLYARGVGERGRGTPNFWTAPAAPTRADAR
jgi:hypothetical protein